MQYEINQPLIGACLPCIANCIRLNGTNYPLTFACLKCLDNKAGHIYLMLQQETHCATYVSMLSIYCENVCCFNIFNTHCTIIFVQSMYFCLLPTDKTKFYSIQYWFLCMPMYLSTYKYCHYNNFWNNNNDKKSLRRSFSNRLFWLLPRSYLRPKSH